MRYLALLAIAVAGPAFAQAYMTPDYRDDRSSPTALIASYYNAINRHEYARAFTYFATDPGPGEDFESFAAGFEDTAHVDLLTGTVSSEGGMSKSWSGVPVAIDAVDNAGKRRQFAGCYLTLLVEPSVMDPPVPGMVIVSGKLHPASGELADILPDACPTG